MVASLGQLLDQMRHHGASRIYAKKLAPNDNSKNQVFLGRDFSALNIIPHGEIYTDDTGIAGAVRDRAKAPVRFSWIDADGRHLAPNTGLILYPKYPEVRLSGFLLGSRGAPNEIMRVRDAGRVLILGITAEGEVQGYAAGAEHPVARELNARDWPTIGVFLELPLTLDRAESPRDRLLSELRRICGLQWIASQKLARDGTKAPYAARNGGGYTLEAELGITPNGYAEPDFMGWEVKQYGVTDFMAFRTKSPVTLMTPEPTGGIYRDEGIAEFLKLFGYPDQAGVPDRFNFGGRYDCRREANHLTGLRMVLTGYDEASGKITDLNGGMSLINANDAVAASWTFKGLMAHWNRKHAQAAYVPSLFRTPPPEYSYGAQVLLCEQTDFLLFLKAFASGTVYYDPAIKVENASSPAPQIKRRSQFRVAHADLTGLYERHESVRL
ncbi:MvaI/BcnI family restriction endonuclease [Sandaracinobacteroides hominis]|uniref:MvaI/BcnI family restriction endonuclease n=1 Tax=Sandaracinobacteroides hominis TaxID=2780086 RepID=UPI0018F3CA2B|nr:MvaI/BcnI family restriction endonuclease [Sandaracinobacteroides hominis]